MFVVFAYVVGTHQLCCAVITVTDPVAIVDDERDGSLAGGRQPLGRGRRHFTDEAAAGLQVAGGVDGRDP